MGERRTAAKWRDARKEDSKGKWLPTWQWVDGVIADLAACEAEMKALRESIQARDEAGLAMTAELADYRTVYEINDFFDRVISDWPQTESVEKRAAAIARISTRRAKEVGK